MNDDRECPMPVPGEDFIWQRRDKLNPTSGTWHEELQSYRHRKKRPIYYTDYEPKGFDPVIGHIKRVIGYPDPKYETWLVEHDLGRECHDRGRCRIYWNNEKNIWEHALYLLGPEYRKLDKR